MNKELIGLFRDCSHYLRHNTESRGSGGRILRIIGENPEINQRELLEIIGIKSGSLSEVLIKLEAKGLIERKQNEEDKRQMLLSVSQKGSMEILRHSEKSEKMDIFAALNLEEQNELQRLLTKLVEDWEPEVREHGHHGRREKHGCAEDCPKRDSEGNCPADCRRKGGKEKHGRHGDFE